MRRFKIPLYLLAMIFTFFGVSDAQIIDCDGIGASPNDTVRVISQFAAPGDTILVPISMVNDTGIATFETYLEYNTNILTPIEIGVDSLFDSLGNFTGLIQSQYDIKVEGRFLRTEIKQDNLGFDYLDTISNVQCVSEIDFPGGTGIGRVRIIGTFEDFFQPEVIIAKGTGTVMYMVFEVSETATHDALATVDFYSETIETRSEVFPYDIIRTDCLYNRYTDSTGTIDRRFTVFPGVVRIDTAHVQCDPPTVNSFTASPSTITTTGGSSTLAWSVSSNGTAVDSVVINNSVGSFTALTGSISVSPTATTSYTLTAYSGTCTSQGFAQVTVDIGGGGGTTNNLPVIQAVSGAPFTVNQGETVSFTVTATDADATDIITLSASSLPANSTFTQAVGSGTVSSTFSFTPDFNQSGSFAAVFTVSDNQGGTGSPLTVLINVNEIQNDRLFTTSAPDQRPVGGLQGTDAVYFPINLVTAQTVYGVQFDFFYDPVYFTVDSFVTTGRTVDYVVYDNIGATPGEIRVFSFGLANEPIVTVEDTTAILYAVMSIDSAAPPADYPVWFENGWESVNPDPDYPSLELVVDSGIIQVDYPGDVNLDRRINVADLVNVVASIINNFTLSNRQFDAADVVLNDTVDVFDLVGIINLVFDVPVTPAPPQIYGGDSGTVALAYSDLMAGGNEMIVVNSEMPVEIAAVELEIDYDPTAVKLGTPQLSAATSNLDINYVDNKAGKMKVLMHYTNPFGNQMIASGVAELLNIPVQALDDITEGNKEQLKITKANFSTSSSAKVEVSGVDSPNPLPNRFVLQQNYPNPFNPTTTIEFTIDASQQVRLEVFNILGQHIKTLADEYLNGGTHIYEWDATDQSGRRVSTGIYLYRLNADQTTESKKMLFLK